MRRGNAPTLQDVAREAGVSAMAVSVVLNGARSATRVSDATRVRIEEAAARLSYRPNAAARGMKRRRMDTIGVVAVVNGYLLDVLGGILEAASARGQNTTVFSVSDWQADERRILGFCDGRVDGVVLAGPHLTPDFAATLGRHAPFVAVHPAELHAHVWRVDVDNAGGAYAVVRHLIALGHRRIAHLAGPLRQAGARERLDGYRRALAGEDIPYDERLVAEAFFTSHDGRTATARLLDAVAAEQVPPFTAVFCANDASAVGCLEALAERGLRVPEDVSVAGFDDAFLARMTIPQLTTARQPFGELGRRAVEMLLAQIEANAAPSDVSRTEVVGAELVVRASTAPPLSSSPRSDSSEFP
ncbi:MAG TPA: LacI family DNA-binding transcriptional regulator [Armatimonadaceae bacterium]|nr:LacI family DNA-binding transcriptional regulator [Armatimonadaceae bacterium]